MTKSDANDYVLQIRKIGTSIGIILPKDLLAFLNLKEGDKLHFVEQTENSVKLSTQDPKHSKTVQIARQLMDEYKDTLNELAK